MLRRKLFTELFLTKSYSRPHLLFAFQAHGGEIIFSTAPQDENSSVVTANHLARFSHSRELFGCTNGFFCYGADVIFKELKNSARVTVVCNPSTGQSLTLPRLSARLRYGLGTYLGYDPMEKEFKVLCVCDGWNVKKHYVLTLGGTKKLTWRVVECSTPHYSSPKWICISGVLYYKASTSMDSPAFTVVCFDMRTEKFMSFVNFSRELPGSTAIVNYNGRLGLLMAGDACYVNRASEIFELWVLREDEWFKHVYVLPLPSLWGDVLAENMRIVGMVGGIEIVLAPLFQRVPSYVIYYNVESKRIRKVGIQGMEAFTGQVFNTYLNYVENMELL